MKPVVQIIGTTGVGKSQLGVELARALKGEIINSDSMQVYKGLDIITNKHPIDQRQGVPHHLLGFLNYDEEYRIDYYERDATQLIEKMHSQDKLPLVVGGTAYYATSLLFRNMLQSAQKTEDDSRLDMSTDELYAELQRVDPQMAARWHPKDHRKIRRSLQLFYETGQTQSQIYAAQRDQGRLGPANVRYRTLFLWLWSQQEVLDERLDQRIQTMIGNGLYDEISDMHQLQPDNPDCTRGIFQAIGFKEFLPYLKSGLEADRMAGIEMMQAATRRYARKQVKWIRNKLLLQCRQAGDDVQVVLLDATDLDQWNTNVKDLGIKAVKDFLNQSLDVNDYGFSELLRPATTIEFSSDPDAWQYWACDICSSFSTNTEEGRRVHLSSRAHKNRIQQIKRRQAFEDWKAQKANSEPDCT